MPAGISLSVGLAAAQVADLADSETTHFYRARLSEGGRIGERAGGEASTSDVFMNSTGTTAK
jgi:hypothetical protein